MVSLRWTAPVLAAAGLAGFAAVFVVEQQEFREAVVGWAKRDLAVRARMAMPSLVESLETSDFKEIYNFGDLCAGNGLRMTVFTPAGGVFFDTEHPERNGGEYVFHEMPCGEFSIRLGVPLATVLAPFERAKTGFLLSALVSSTGVLLVFLLVYRQGVRIRELKKVEKFRRDFIADFSHEMKTPLTGIIGAVDLLGANPQADASTRATLLGLLHDEAERLNALAQNILDLARLEDAGQTLAKTREDAFGIVEDTVRRLSGKAKTTRLATEGDRGIECECDRHLVEQALANLVENALRHSGAGTVKVSAARWRGGVKFAVEDDGCGIPAEHAKKIFDRFHRVDPSRTAGGGAGLGLSIVRRIARLHGGEATLERVEPHGSRFVIAIP